MEAVKRVCSPSGSPMPPGCTMLAVSASARDTILPGDGIYGNQTLVSKNGVFELGFFSPGPDIYHFLGVQLTNLPAIAGHKRFWFGDRVYITDLSSAALELFGDRLCIMEAGANLWGTTVAGDGPPPATASAVLLDTGNLVVTDQANSSRILWQSFDFPGDALLPGARLGFDRDTGKKNISLTYTDSWYNGSLAVDPSRKNGFVLTVDGRDVVIPGTFPDWMVSSQENGSSLVLLNHPRRPDFSEHLQLHLGQVSLRSWSDSRGRWVDRWTFPSDCKSGPFFCGRFGVCKSNGRCGCVTGFEPSKPSEWQIGYFVNGCSRSLPLSCVTNNGHQTLHDDSFVPLHRLQGLPYNPQDDSAESAEDCRESCLSKCYCVAYAYEYSGCKLWYNILYNVSAATRPPYSKVYVRLGSELRPRKRGLQTIGIVLLVVGLAGITCLILILAALWTYRRDLLTCRKFQVEGPLSVYPYAQLKRATRNFSEKLSEGGFGCVFRGTMPGPTVVAVKRLKGLGHADKQFRAEVQTLGVIQHTNLVRLLGFSVKGNTRLLVYEYMANGSLDSHLFSEDSALLTWDIRYRIALGIAKGLAYLHEECQNCIIHCDIKPENILLDAEFGVKIADFGMAKLLGREFNSALTTIRGTMGYLAPEWVSGQRITKKADVYSFGIVLLEIISGRRSTRRLKSGGHRYFPLYAAAQLNEGEDLLPLLDHRLEGNANVKELDVACRVACWCIQDEESNRPSMGQVVRMLEGVLNAEIPPVPSSFMDLVDGENSGTYSEEGFE
ncbi:hypothetical protein HU200_034283 [Digitaria exilis]|uniref:Receptor-like serine/threonine-protein kinase n=1 Tax=Digitaria exilis TaxID=1010633 RepID=A0A835BTX5_9POAL|nr:hypothetical protein HU200_034283 [Digitaria exilis]